MTRRLALGVAMAFVMSAAVQAVAAEPPRYLDERFEQGTDYFNSTAWGIHVTSGGHAGGGLVSTMRPGQHWGSSGWWYFSSNGHSPPEQLYWRYWLRFGSDFYIEPPSRGKLPGPASLNGPACKGGVPSSETYPCFSARMLFSRTYPKAGEPGYPNGPDDQTLIGFYVYHLDSPANRGDIWTWDPDVATLEHGQWYCVEGLIRLNTPGQHDGALKGWVDGEEAFVRGDVAFRRADEADMRIKSFWYDIYYGGGATSPVENSIRFDSLALSNQRIGCDDGFDGTFFDDDGSIFEDDIEWMAANSITNGCNPPQNSMYCPKRSVSREVMSVYLARALQLPPSPKDYFEDDGGSQFEDEINSLAHAGIAKGCNPPANDMFCPRQTVDRGQMAAFLVRALDLTDDGGGDLFGDDDRSIFESDIDRLAAAGVTRGCNPPANTRFCPLQKVDRGQMAAFIRRAIDG